MSTASKNKSFFYKLGLALGLVEEKKVVVTKKVVKKSKKK